MIVALVLPEEPVQSLREALKRIPGLRAAVRFARDERDKMHLSKKSIETIFADIYTGNKWRGRDSASGTGSDLRQTEVVRNALPALWEALGIRTMLDVPCGDFHWMKHVALERIEYTGADIVLDMVERNREYETSTIHFCRINLVEDKLPRFDLIFCRDCLVHLSFKDAQKALQNICDSGSTYLLTTTFSDLERNVDIATGQWRKLNLTLSPFSLSPPALLINENCTEGDAYRDKSLGLWKVDVIRASLTKPHSSQRMA